MPNAYVLAGLFLAAGLWCMRATAEPKSEKERDFTCFQIAAPYSPQLDIASDMAVVYGIDDTFAARVHEWRKRGYAVGMMTGISWGNYAEYYGTGRAFKRAEVQTRKNGELFMHSPDVGYNVPTPSYIEFIKRHVEPAIDEGVRAIFLEEPEFWGKAGWSPAFQEAWRRFYGEPWQAPDSSPDAQYRASKLKYELYFNALKEVMAHIKTRAAAQNRRIECIVPTHSLINYAHWQIVSPESRLIDIPHLDGYVAQVWTGTARQPNRYRGVEKERTFETAYFEYGQMAAMVAPTGRKVWFLADPVEDNPNHTWNDYRRNYESTVIASLLWPSVSRYAVMPWPERIFQGNYPATDMDAQTGARAGIPKDYAAQILTIINALNDMEQRDIEVDSGTPGIGVVVSDSMMFQRAEPDIVDLTMGNFYGLALPLLKAGVPVRVFQLENSLQKDAFKDFRVLLLTYEGQKPLKPAYHDALVRWVKRGGCLIVLEDNADPYHHVREWWNDYGKTDAKAYEDLFAKLGVFQDEALAAYKEPQRVGRGWVFVRGESSNALSKRADGDAAIRDWVKTVLAKQDRTLTEKNYLRVQRGPYIIVSVMDESVSDAPLRLTGDFVDLFDPQLGYSTGERVVHPGEHVFLYDVAWAKKHRANTGIIAASARTRNVQRDKRALRFAARGPEGSTATVRLMLPAPIKSVTTSPSLAVTIGPDDGGGVFFVAFPNIGAEVSVNVAY
ncbi:MAG TPA: hypothetical protein PLO62_00080 [Candidatus Hydrogenedentes bacterium]|nr:hypothetical protein [Candidatus Hydrogenedentota bacterium]